MDNKIVNNIFEEVAKEWDTYIDNEGVNGDKFKKYEGMNASEILGTAYAETLLDSTRFIQKVLQKLMESNDFKRELFKDMMEQAEEEEKRTGKNPFKI